jgi:Na+-driven multidrug efflux pump
MLLWGLGTGIVFGAVVVLTRPLYVPLFTSDPDVRALLAQVIVVFAVFEPVAGVVFVLDGVLIGAGDGRYLAYAGCGRSSRSSRWRGWYSVSVAGWPHCGGRSAGS